MMSSVCLSRYLEREKKYQWFDWKFREVLMISNERDGKTEMQIPRLF